MPRLVDGQRKWRRMIVPREAPRLTDLSLGKVDPRVKLFGKYSPLRFLKARVRATGLPWVSSVRAMGIDIGLADSVSRALTGRLKMVRHVARCGPGN